MAGAAPGFAAGRAGSLSVRGSEMKMIVADQARPAARHSPISWRRIDHANGGMPIDADDPFALAPLDQYVVAMDRGEECQSLHPIYTHPQRVIVAQIVEFGGIFVLDGGDPHGLALAVGLRLFAGRRPQRGKFHLRGPAKIVVILVNPSAVAVEPAAHRVEEGLEIAPHVILYKWLNPGPERDRVPGRAGAA